MKRCSCCGETKPLDAFNRSATARDGRQSWCRDCKRIDAKRRYHLDIEKGRATSRLRMRARRAADPEGMAAYIADWRERNADRVRARDARRRQRPERRAWQTEYWRRWKAENSERAREISRRGALARRARIAGAFVEDVDPLVVLDRGAGICGICGETVDPASFHVDHIIPIARGGEHSYANTQPAHPRCNQVKNDRLIEPVAA